MRKDCWVAKSDYQNRVKRYRELVQDVLANFPNVQVFDPSEFLCDDSICRAKDGLNFIYRDCDHLSDYGSAILVEKMKPLILNLMSE
jgi:hypothetical protein